MSFVAKFVGKKILGETLQNKFGKDDPYFEQVPATRLDGKPSKKMKKRRKALPPGISEHDAQVLTKVKRRAYRLDMALFSFLGVRFGWGSAIGIIPAVGDVLDMLMALMVLKTCGQVEGGLPTGVKLQMLFNIALDFVVGLVPFVGDLVDAIFRCNTRNAMLLEDYLREKGKKQLRQSGLPVPAVDPSRPEEFDRWEESEPPAYASQPPHGHTIAQQSMPREPEPARTGERRGWFSRSTTKPSDVEMAQSNGNGQRHLQKEQRNQRTAR